MAFEQTASTAALEPTRSEPVAERALRRALDLAVAALVLVLAAPILLLIAALVRLDSRGPAIFRQRRIGLNQQQFTVHKFRTMRAEADPTPHRDYIAQLVNGDGGRRSDGSQSLFKLTADDRVTRIGKLLRKTSVDELPQLWNVLRGEMSLVGPRPVVPYELEHYAPRYFGRFAVKPGLTGLWQVSGRNEKSYTEMVELDLEYVERRSLGLDISILFKTLFVVVERRGVA